MAKALQYASRCIECGQRIPAGEEAQFFQVQTADGLRYEHAHVTCPQKPVRQQNASPGFDVENLFVTRKCSECGELWSFRKGGGLAPNCPAPKMRKGERVLCGGAWMRGDEPWAA